MMVFTFERVNYQEIRRLSNVSTKIIIGFLVLIYFAESQLTCNENIPWCDKRLKELKKHVKDWNKRCLDNKGLEVNSSCCEAEKGYNQLSMSTHSKICQYKGPYPEPYMFIRSMYQIYAIDLLTHDRTVVVNRLKYGYVMEIDTVDMKLYFTNKYGICRANFDGTDIEGILQIDNVYGLAFDWIGRRIFWTQYLQKWIFVANLDGTGKRALIQTSSSPYGIAVDPTVGYLFWIHKRELNRMSLATNNVRTLPLARTFSWFAITLDRTNKRVYWLEKTLHVSRIFSADYDGMGRKKVFTFSGSLLSVSGDSLYVLNDDFYINEISVSNGNISSRIMVDPAKSYYDLIVVDSSLRPLVKEGCPNVPCGPFGYCNKIINGSYTCQCEDGFFWNNGTCADIDECLSSPCGAKANNSCTNLQGSYKCTCGRGYFLDENGRRCIAYSDLQIRLVNPKNKRTAGRVEVFHPSFGWGTVCGLNRWTDTEGSVFCRQLGFTGVNATRKYAYYGGGSGPILLNNIRCTGNESYIWECSHHGWNVYPMYCSHWFDLGVDCY